MPPGIYGPAQYRAVVIAQESEEARQSLLDVIHFAEKKVLKKAVEVTAEVLTRSIGFIGSLLGETILSPTPLGEGEERAITAMLAQQTAEQQAREQQRPALVSPVGESDP